MVRFEASEEAQRAVEDVIWKRFRGKVDGNRASCIACRIGAPRGRSQRQDWIVEAARVLASGCQELPKVSLISFACRSPDDSEVNHVMHEAETVSGIRRCARPEVGRHSELGSSSQGSTSIRRNPHAACRWQHELEQELQVRKLPLRGADAQKCRAPLKSDCQCPV